MLLTQLDYHLFQLVNHFTQTVPVLNPVMRFLAQDAEYLFYIAVLIYWFTRNPQNRRMVAQALLSACVALGFSGVIGDWFYRDRPFVAHHVFLLIQHLANASFPSDHATGAFVIAATIWIFRRREGWAWLFIAACIGVSRVWVGVHYPSDVIVGACLGVLTSAVVHQLLNRSLPLNNLLQSGIGVYEKIERKIWAS